MNPKLSLYLLPCFFLLSMLTHVHLRPALGSTAATKLMFAPLMRANVTVQCAQMIVDMDVALEINVVPRRTAREMDFTSLCTFLLQL